jgi:hypothetical protein
LTQKVEKQLDFMAEVDATRALTHQTKKSISAQKVKKQETTRKINKNPITSFLIGYVIEVEPVSGFLLCIECVMLLCKKERLLCTKPQCFRAMQAAAAGLGAKLPQCQVTFMSDVPALAIETAA